MESTRLAVLGAGYVGLVTAAALADMGHDVRVYDPDAQKTALLRSGRAAFFEPGLDELLERVIDRGRLHVADTTADAVRGAQAAFIAVGTPSAHDGRTDLRAVRASVEAVAAGLDGATIVVNKSTVPVETADLVQTIVQTMRPELHVPVVSNPEFLREGTALYDFFHPDRIVLGVQDPAAEAFMRELYAPLGARTIVTDRHTAELIKYAANAFLATKISFINEVASICERVGGDIDTLVEGIGSDARIGPHYLQPGLGFGGSCLPKDVRALCATATRVATQPALLSAVLSVNAAQIERISARIAYVLEGLSGRRIALLGMAFKANTDDVRESPAIALARNLLVRGASLRVHDPAAHLEAGKALAMFSEGAIEAAPDVERCVADADAVVLATPWPQYAELDPQVLARLVRRPVLFDTRNFLDGARYAEAGFHYNAVGSASRPYPLAATAVAS